MALFFSSLLSKISSIFSPLDEFITSLIELIRNPDKLNELGNNGLDYVTKNHNWGKLSDNLLLIFQDLISKSKFIK